MSRSARNAEEGRLQSQRQLRVGEEMKHALARILPRTPFRDSDLHDRSITVTEVRTSPDLKVATAYVMPLGGDDGARIVAALNRAATFLRGRVAAEVRLKYVPALRFVLDDTFDAAAQIEAALADPEVARDLGHAEGGGNEA